LPLFLGVEPCGFIKQASKQASKQARRRFMRKKRFIVLASCGFLGLHAVIYNGSKQASKQASKHEGRYRRSLACACLLAGFIRPGRAGPPPLFI
jgi:hypothetical protein